MRNQEALYPGYGGRPLTTAKTERLPARQHHTARTRALIGTDPKRSGRLPGFILDNRFFKNKAGRGLAKPRIEV